MRRNLTDVLGALAVLLIAGGVGAALAEYIQWWALAVSGGLVLVASEVSDWRSTPKNPEGET